MTVSDNIALASAGGAVISALVACIALYIAGRAQGLNLAMFKRQHVIELHLAWSGVNELVLPLVGPDVQKAANALELTAALWNHDVVDKTILVQMYWEPFRELRDFLRKHEKEPVPGYTTKSCGAFLSREIERAYEEMKKLDQASVQQTTLKG